MRVKKLAANEIELDLGRYELRRRGRRVKLEKKPMELLIFLVSRREQLISRKEIVAKLWRSDLFIDTEPNINNIVRKIRTALGDHSAKPRFLETVVGKGYRFIGPLRVIDARYPQSDFASGAMREVSREKAGGWSERSSLAVLPLMLLGKPTDDSGVCLGLADALVTRLGNLPGVDVLPTSAVLNMPVEATPAETASRLGVRFVVHGAIQMSKGVWRLSMEMFDTHLHSACFTRKSDLDVNHLSDLEDEIAKQIAVALNRPLGPGMVQRPRYSKDPMAYAEFVRGYRLSFSGDPGELQEAIQHLANAVTRDPVFSLAHAAFSVVCATRHFELDPTSAWLEKAEFHCRRALALDPDLPEGHVANAFLLWGPSKNFQHLEAIAELKRALALQYNQPQAYNRLGTILAHIGLFDHAREMYERGRPFHPRKAVSHSLVQVYVWNQEFDLAREEIQAWRAENPDNKYPVYFAPQVAMMSGDLKGARILLDEAAQLLREDPLIVSLQGVFYASMGREGKALDCLSTACASPKSFGHAHHTYYQIACILALLGRREAAFEWLERSVSCGFACWPFFLKDPYLKNLRELPAFEVLVSSLQAKYPDHLGLL
ncbi:MAG TPA: winged helix-turn-helix domain-containing protein [Candidatus Sulfotelmatobacter sp.]|jgi:DNA-binding winged helix-turn-helix (wHTH) protein/tetratricopeptide (TPR) repeat protein|nr:winged helix-turn-helix domain-containing protein [Candidatus Sulfotelmatobacter sp.]